MEQTNNYDLFKYSGLNRNIVQGHIQKLINEVEKLKEENREYNITKLSPVLVDNNMNVIDGQHRIKAMEALELPVYYIKADLRASDMVAINVRRKEWRTDDYVNYYVGTGEKEYEKLLKLHDRFPGISYTDILRLDRLSFAYHTTMLKTGEFKFTDYAKTVKRLEDFWNLVQLNPVFKIHAITVGYIAALKSDSFNAEILYEAVRTSGGIFRSSTEPTENYKEILRMHDAVIRASKK